GRWRGDLVVGEPVHPDDNLLARVDGALDPVRRLLDLALLEALLDGGPRPPAAGAVPPLRSAGGAPRRGSSCGGSGRRPAPPTGPGWWSARRCCRSTGRSETTPRSGRGSGTSSSAGWSRQSARA